MIHYTVSIFVQLIKRNFLRSLIKTCSHTYFYTFSLHFLNIDPSDILKKYFEKFLRCLLLHNARHKYCKLIASKAKSHILIMA